jgi:hypothetical protein
MTAAVWVVVPGRAAERRPGGRRIEPSGGWFLVDCQIAHHIERNRVPVEAGADQSRLDELDFHWQGRQFRGMWLPETWGQSEKLSKLALEGAVEDGGKQGVE